MWSTSAAHLHHLCSKVGIISERQICSHCSISLQLHHHSLTSLPHLLQGFGTACMRALNLFECKADICVLQSEDAQPARQTSGDAVPTVFPPTFSGGVGQARSGRLPIPEPYRDSQSIGPLAAKRRSQSLLKMDRSGAVCAVHLQQSLPVMQPLLRWSCHKD